MFKVSVKLKTTIRTGYNTYAEWEQIEYKQAQNANLWGDVIVDVQRKHDKTNCG